MLQVKYMPRVLGVESEEGAREPAWAVRAAQRGGRGRSEGSLLATGVSTRVIRETGAAALRLQVGHRAGDEHRRSRLVSHKATGVAHRQYRFGRHVRSDDAVPPARAQ